MLCDINLVLIICIATLALVNHISCVEISVTVLPDGLNKPFLSSSVVKLT